MRNLRQLMRRSGLLSSQTRRRNAPQAGLGATRRRLSSEALEKRELLAGDIAAAPEIAFAHNYYHPADVDDNRQVTAGDALRVINLLESSDGGMQITEPGMIDSYSDVNGDGWVTASDALSVINALSQPEAAINDFRMLLDITDANDNLLTDATTRNINANVGDEVYLQLSYFDDRRLTDVGAFQIVTDITYNESTDDVFSPIVSETQEVNFENTLINAFSGFILISLEDDPTEVKRIDINDFIGNGVADELQGAVVELGNYAEDEIVVTPLIREGLGRLPGQPPVEEKADENFPFRIRYNLSGDQANVDVPDIVIAFEDLDVSVDVEVTSFSPIDPATGEVRGEAVGRSLDVRSRDVNSSDPFGAPLYNLLTSGTFDGDNNIFDELRVIGPLNSGGIPAAIGESTLPEPLDTFSVRLMLDKPGVVSFALDPAEDDEFVLLYGEDDANSTLDPDRLVLDEILSVVTITVSGPDNQAPVISVEAANGDSASQTLTETNSGLTVSDTLTVTDTDTADTVSASVVSVSESGDGTGVVSNTDLLAMLSVTNNPVLDGTETTGPINYTFDSGTEAFNHLDAGESLVLTYTVQASDTIADDDQTVVITINGTTDEVNVAPIITVETGDSATQTLTETDSALSVSDTLTVSDANAADTVTASVVSVVESGDGTGVVSNANLLAMLSVTNNPVLNSSSTTGPINYTFNSGSEAFNHLNVGDSLVLTYTVNASDGQLSDDQTVVITINGSNSAPVITVGAGDSATQTLTETDDGLTASGTLTVSDSDTADTVNAAVVSVVESGDGTGVVSNANLLAMLSVTNNPVLDNSSTTGSINYTFDSGTEAFNHLNAGESLVLTYNVRATDTPGDSDDQTVVVTINGSVENNNPPVITIGAGDSASQALTENGTGLTASGTLTVSDVDTIDTVSAAVVSVGVVSGDDNGISNAALLAMMTLGANPVIDNASNTGTISYTFNSGSEDFNHLSAGQTLVLNYNVRASDSSGGTDDQSVTVTLTGTNDDPTATNNQASIAKNAGGPATGNVITDDDGSGVDSDPDNNDVLTVSAVGSETNPAVDVTGSFGTLDWSADGGYSYAVDTTNAQVIALAADETLSDTFTYTISDGNGGTDSATLAITITGINDPPTATNNSNSIAEDAAAPVAGNVITDDDGAGVDSDPNGDTLTVADINGVTNQANDVTGSFGTLDWGTDGSYSYAIDNSNASVQALAVGETLSDAFTYTVSDGKGGTDTATLTITITGTNDDPTATNNSNSLFGGSTTPVTGNVISDDDGNGVDSDPDTSDVLTVSGIDSVTNPANDVVGSFGTLDWASDGSYSYAVDNNNAAVQALQAGQTLTETFTYTIDDSNGGSDSATLTVTITAINPSTISGAVFIDHVENIQEFIASGGTVDPFRNGVKDSDEKGISGLLMRLVDASGATVDTEYTDINGEYTFENVAPGTHHVTFDEMSTILYLGDTSILVGVEAPGGATINNIDFAAINTVGSAGNTLDILASSFNGTSGSSLTTAAQQGAVVSLESGGLQNFFIAGAGFEGITNAELALNVAQDEALLTVIEEDGDVVTRILTSDDFKLRSGADGIGVEIKGGLNSFAIIGDTDQPSFPTYRETIDAILADE